jgi:hypothetical protein
VEDVTKQAAELSGQLAALNAEREELKREIATLTTELQAKTKRAMECKTQAAQVTLALANVKVREKVLTDEQAAAKARADAEQHLAAIMAKEAQLDAAIKRAEEAAAKASSAAADAKEAAEASKPQG